ncbi:uncharacterized protein DS421_13g403340 [Arachis hypogaea]|nr:uncharacterized protein DS421_13g403340 [Arachis hypogaea]
MGKKAKLAEIEAIGFDFLRRVPQWHVKQIIMLQLARAYDMETNTLRGSSPGTFTLSPNLSVMYSAYLLEKISLAVSDIKGVRDAIRKFQDENWETCGGCMFVLLVLHFQRLKHGPLHACYVPEPWIVEWTTNELDKKANHVISQGCIVNNARKQKKKKKKQTPSETVNEKGRSKRPRKDADQSPSIQRRTTSQPSYKDSDKVICFLYDGL